MHTEKDWENESHELDLCIIHLSICRSYNCILKKKIHIFDKYDRCHGDIIILGVVAGLVQSWAAIVYGILSGSIPWVSMMVLHKKSSLLQKVRLLYDRFFIFYLFFVCALISLLYSWNMLGNRVDKFYSLFSPLFATNKVEK